MVIQYLHYIYQLQLTYTYLQVMTIIKIFYVIQGHEILALLVATLPSSVELPASQISRLCGASGEPVFIGISAAVGERLTGLELDSLMVFLSKLIAGLRRFSAGSPLSPPPFIAELLTRLCVSVALLSPILLKQIIPYRYLLKTLINLV